MNFNKKIAEKILLDLQSTKELKLSLTSLEDNIFQNLAAVDSTFPSQIRDMIEGILSKLTEHQQKQYSTTLNTSEEGTYDETLSIGDLFDPEILRLKEYTLNRIDLPNSCRNC